MTLDMFIRIQIEHNDEKTVHSSVGLVSFIIFKMHQKYIVNLDITRNNFYRMEIFA